MEYLTTEEACKVLHITRNTLSLRVKKGQVIKMKDERSRRVFYQIPEPIETYNAKEACFVLKICRSTFDRLVKEGILTAIPNTYPKEYSAEQIDAYKESFFSNLKQV